VEIGKRETDIKQEKYKKGTEWKTYALYMEAIRFINWFVKETLGTLKAVEKSAVNATYIYD